MSTGQDIYNLCRCLERYPDVFDAFYELTVEQFTGEKPRETFNERRERTRAQRLAKYA